ncbi:Tetratricopeptide repeat-containing protein [Cyclonatronum proteinivorum]|uniref:Tetratricopeptide repeat-containing protein n=1 Tax=Cyclonatronum proteinivorum TaxID=1457365 RepID=A0A345UNS9_9BACT|nr:tetratricopeptide repeat protein [Cyclonatronum proteinivorum]AXJ02131.1 Tetratricopeptide repeat-containing protein [Cyclonatronum proteinivorum]
MLTRSLGLVVLLVFFVFDAVIAQQRVSFQRANQFYSQGEYELAADMYRELLQQNPENIPVIDRLATTLVQMRQYEEAIELLADFTRQNPGFPNLSVRVGEIYHTNGQRDEALAWWRKIVEQNERNVQVYRLVAESMVNRREHEQAARLYRDARGMLGNEQVFGFDIAQNFTAAGLYEETMREYSHLLRVNPGFIHAIQRQIARYEDDFFLDTGIMEFEEASRNLRQGSEEWVGHRRMLIWLYNERGLYRRSFTTAQNLEDRLDGADFPVFELGRRLVNLNEFELAEQAFERYTNTPSHELFVQARQQLSQLYIRRARYLLSYNLDFDDEAASLHEKAYTLLSEIPQEAPQFRGMGEVYAALVELSLDYLRDLDRAVSWNERFDGVARSERDRITADYLTGRISLFEQDFMRARLALSRANRAAGTGEMAEKTRYFLSLAEFYSGEYEFARLQMRSLQRQTTSLYANDALRLRSLLQEGIVQDSVSSQLRDYTRALFEYNSGNKAASLELLLPFMQFSAGQPLQTEALLLTAHQLRHLAPDIAFSLIHTFIEGGQPSAQREQLFWERARLAESIAQAGTPQRDISGALQTVVRQFLEQAAQQADSKTGSFTDSRYTISDALDLSRAIFYYEELIIEYPAGFYAQEARERIRLLQRAS